MIVRDIVRPISRSIVSSILGYDPSAQSYFTAVEAAGGSFDLTSTDPTYTESYVKQAHSDFYAGLKSDGVWDKLTEFYLLTGKTFGGITVKGKALPDSLEYASDFSSGVDGWAAIGGTVAGNVDSIGGLDDILSITADSSTGQHRAQRDTLTASNNYSVSVDVFIPASNVNVDGFAIGVGSSGDYQVLETPSRDTWTTVTVTATTSFPKLHMHMADGSDILTVVGNGTDVIYIRNVQVTQLNGSLTNNNFVTGDYLPAGTGAGLTGDASSKYIDTGLAQSAIAANDSHLSGYLTATSGSSFQHLIGAEASSNTDSLRLQSFNTGTEISFSDSSGGFSILDADGFATGMLIGTKKGVGVNETELYRNGAIESSGQDSSTRTPYAGSLYILALNRGGSATSLAAHTPTFLSTGSALDATDASNLSTRVNTLMTSLGCNTY